MRMKCNLSFIMLVCTIFAFVALSTRTDSQTEISKLNSARLQKKVHLDLGMTTIETLTKELSTQTGCVIKAQSYLFDHNLCIEIEGVSASKVLTMVSDMNRWRWVEDDKGEIVLSHRKIITPENPSQFAKVFHDVFPVSWGPFIGLNVDFNLMLTQKQLEDKKETESQIEQANDLSTREFLKKNELSDMTTSAAMNIYRRFNFMGGDGPILKLLFPMLPEALKNNRTLSYTKWDNQLKDSVLKYDFVTMFQNINAVDPIRRELYQGGIRDYLLQPENAELKIIGGGLRIGKEYQLKDGSRRSSFVAHQLSFLEKDKD